MKAVMKLFSLLSFVGAAACSDPVAVESDILVAHMSDKHLELTNTSRERLFYFAVGNATIALVNWAPCVDVDDCPSVNARSTRSVPAGDVIFNKDHDTAIVVYHWKLIPATNSAGYTFDSVRVVTVPVR
jgi:hypothetical protein